MRCLGAWCCSLAIFLMGMGCFSSDLAARDLVVVINDAPPYRIIEETTTGQAYSGIYIDVVREAAARADVKLTFQVVPFKRALFLMEGGEADLMLGPNRTDERSAYMYYFGAALPNEPKVIYTGDRESNVRQITDLEGKQVGVLRGAIYGWQLSDAKNIALVEAANYETLFRMLDRRRIDALIVPELLAISHINKFGPFAIAKADLVFQGQPSFIAVSRKSDYFLEGDYTALENHLVEMRQDGTFDAIYARYAGPDH